jgi:hypothetical protein
VSTIVDPRRKANVRLAIILASIAVVFFVGFVAKHALFG